MTICAYPEVAQAIFADRDRVCPFSSSSKVKIFVSLRTAVDTMKGAVSTDPEDSLMIFVNGADKGFIPVGRVTEVVTIPFERQGFRCKACEPKTGETRPDDSFPIQKYGANAVLGETLRIVEAIAIADESFVFPIELEQPSTVRCKP